MKLPLFILLISTIFIGACRGEISASANATIEVESSSPQLIAFNVIDSYGVNTEFDAHIPLTVSPFQDDGFFEIFWDVDNFSLGFDEDYQVNFYINDRPGINNSILISANFCGFFDRCNDFGYQQCFYNSDLSVSCTLPNSDLIDATVDISDLFVSIPEPLYMVLEVCDVEGFNCDVDAWPVLFE